MKNSLNPRLLTPGPLTTSEAVRGAQLMDFGSRDSEFRAITRSVIKRLEALSNAQESHVAVLLQGSGTFATEAAIGTLLDETHDFLVCVNGAYGERVASISDRLGKRVKRLTAEEHVQIDPVQLRTALEDSPEITHVALVHLETTTGLLNPLEEIAEVVAEAGAKLIVDAMSSFGAYEIDLQSVPIAALIASSNKCLHGTPGAGFVFVDEALLRTRANKSSSTCLDLHAQWRGFEDTEQWRFTPPCQTIAALEQALVEHANAGGITGRKTDYTQKAKFLADAMKENGFSRFLDPDVQSYVIQTFTFPKNAPFDFDEFYEAMKARNFYIYPGKTALADTFRLGNIGELTFQDVRDFADAVAKFVSKYSLVAAR